MRERWWCGERCYRRSGWRGAKEDTEASILDPPFCSGLLFHRQTIQCSDHYSSSSSRDPFAVGKEGLVQSALAMIDREFLGLLTHKFFRTMDLTMSENDRIDPLATAHATEIY